MNKENYFNEVSKKPVRHNPNYMTYDERTRLEEEEKERNQRLQEKEEKRKQHLREQAFQRLDNNERFIHFIFKIINDITSLTYNNENNFGTYTLNKELREYFSKKMDFDSTITPKTIDWKINDDDILNISIDLSYSTSEYDYILEPYYFHECAKLDLDKIKLFFLEKGIEFENYFKFNRDGSDHYCNIYVTDKINISFPMKKKMNHSR